MLVRAREAELHSAQTHAVHCVCVLPRLSRTTQTCIHSQNEEQQYYSGRHGCHSSLSCTSSVDRPPQAQRTQISSVSVQVLQRRAPSSGCT
ncbi:hypothetical protein GOP47_0005125 [Adiantum capillus-veneris]|uniref:Uncharacterized protein n=1 Tax=Adiantum capillus-veneris TaxID=13818 RepID=A0A9D4ZNB5_ADICA|nr:hypothetical protein GOP47_0005125 [Adiantum capillus-veneris]